MIHCSRLKLRLHDPTPAAAPLSPFLDLDLSEQCFYNIIVAQFVQSSKTLLGVTEGIQKRSQNETIIQICPVAQVGVHKAPVQQQIASGTVYRGISSVCYGMSELWT